jgi:SpoIVB peptidase S55
VKRLLLAITLATLLPAPPSRAATPTLPLESIHPGMTGVGRSVFEGDTVEEFGVEILGVLKNAVGPRQDLILARLHGEKVEYTGVVSGMSGSPIYIDGKLIGALSYRIGPFAKEPIAGITPIADMLRMGRPPLPAAEAGRGAAPDLLGRFLGDTGGGTAAERSPGSVTAAGSDGALRPIDTPLLCAGCDARVLRYYAPIFQAQGLDPVAGGGVAEGVAATPLVPGSPVGAALAIGDLNITGIGTLTMVDGRTIYAFGHPFLSAGEIEAPMTQAQVLLTFPSINASFKIANATAPVGTIVRDGLTGIVGEQGRVAPLIPVTARITTGAETRSFHYDILRHRSWSPVLLALTLANSLTRTTEFDPSSTLKVAARIAIKGQPEVRMEDLYSSPNPAHPLHLAVANEIAGLFNLLYNNPFEAIEVTSVEADVEMLPPARVARLSSLRASDTDLRPGDGFTVSAVLTPFRGEDRSVSWKVTVPDDMPPGEAQIIVAGGSTLDGLDRRVLQRRIAQAGSLRDLMRVVGGLRTSHGLYLRMVRRAPSAIIRSDLLPDLPLSIFSVLNNPRLSADTTLMIEAPILELARDLDLVVVGGRRISIKVK